MSPWEDLKGQRSHSDQSAPSTCESPCFQASFPPLGSRVKPVDPTQNSPLSRDNLEIPGNTFVKSHKAEATTHLGTLPFSLLPEGRHPYQNTQDGAKIQPL